MTDLSWWAYVLMLAAPIALTLVFTPVALNLAQRLGIFDHPGPSKAHRSPVPYLGGAAIVVAFSIIVIGAALLRPPPRLGDLVIFLGMAVGLAMVGLIDDIRTLSPWIRLALEVAAGLGVWATGTSTRLPFPEPLNLIATVLWVVVVTNAFNLLDNMDGLSAGVAAISSAFLFVIAMLNGRFLVASLALALAGCAVGFLRHNFHPARIYMGDAGSLFIGFVLAVISLMLRTRVSMSIFVPVLVVGVALFDTTLVMATRLYHRRSPVLGGQDHVSHRLVFLGVPVWASVSLIYTGAIGFGWLAVVMDRVDPDTSYILMGLVMSVALCLGALLAMVPVHGRSSRARGVQSKATEMQPAPRAPESPYPSEETIAQRDLGIQASEDDSEPVPALAVSDGPPEESPLRLFLNEDLFRPGPRRWHLTPRKSSPPINDTDPGSHGDEDSAGAVPTHAERR